MTRTPKTDKQRAEGALGVAQRRVKKALAKRDTTLAAADAARTELEAAQVRLTYAKADPALKTLKAAEDLPADPADTVRKR